MGERLTIEEIRERYDGEWVILADPANNPEGEIDSGVVVAHHIERDLAYDGMLKAKGNHFATLCLKELPEGWTLAL